MDEQQLNTISGHDAPCRFMNGGAGRLIVAMYPSVGQYVIWECRLALAKLFSYKVEDRRRWFMNPVAVIFIAQPVVEKCMA